jgi:hypothetical protein
MIASSNTSNVAARFHGAMIFQGRTPWRDVFSMIQKYRNLSQLTIGSAVLNADLAGAGSRESAIVYFVIALQRTHPMAETPTTILQHP